MTSSTPAQRPDEIVELALAAVNAEFDVSSLFVAQYPQNVDPDDAGPFEVDIEEILSTALTAVTPAIIALGAAEVRAAVEALHHRHGDHRDQSKINGPWFCCGLVQLGGIGMNDCDECYRPFPCPTIAALSDGDIAPSP